MFKENKLDRTNIENIMSLTSLQQGMLFHYISDGESKQYHELLSLKIKGDIKLDLLQKSWDFVIENNEMLRTIFRWREVENPVQIVLKNHHIPIEFIDFTKDTVQYKSIEDVKAQDLNSRIDITIETLRIYLCKIDENIHEMIISNHHILYDGWSNGIILKEVMEAYSCLYEGKEPRSINKAKFSQFIKYLNYINKEDQKKYWSNYLEGLDYKDDCFSCKEVGIYKEILYTIDDIKINKIKEFSKQNKVLLSSILYGIWGVLLQKFNNSNEVLFGTTVSGRPENIISIDKMVGLFINTIPLRVKTDEKTTLLELINLLDKSLNERKDFENTSLTDIKEYCGSKANEELFNSIVAIENYPFDLDINKNNVLKLVNVSITEQINCNMGLEILTYNGIQFKFKFNSLSIEDSIVNKLGTYLERIINSLLINPNIEIRSIDLLSEQEKNQLLYDFNNKMVSYCKNKTIHELFEAQVEKTPDNIAVVFEKTKLTYRELNERANILAWKLRDEGVKADTIVGIMLEKSFEMIIGIIGILKAGGVYLPIDPNYPKERIKYIVNDSKINILLSKENLLHEMEFDGKFIDLYDKELLVGNLNNLEVINNSNKMAYIIYTSGTTGNPKGVIIQHESIVNRLIWAQETYKLCEKDCVLQGASFSFDFSIWEIFGTLIAGAKLILPYNDGSSDISYIISLINKYKVTTVHFVPSVLKLFLENDDVKTCKSIRLLFTGGEQLTPSLRDSVFEKLDTELYNQYGPTETTIDSTYYHCIRGNVQKLIPIGKPIYNTEVYIMDSNHHIVPIGVTGELYIGGSGVALGYLNNPELTSEKFIQNPFKFAYKDYIYKTGDLARFLPDGNIEFMGRVDQQVKIRGMRIELNEVEEIIKKHPFVKDTVVIDRERADGDKYLCAYIVPKPEKAQIIEGKQRFRLPNNLAIVHLNKNETLFLYKEIFEVQAYMKHGISIKDSDCVFDVGSNIGLFTLYSHLAARNVKLFSFEPNPYVFNILRLNTVLYNVNAKLFNCGLSNKVGIANFTFYPKFSFLSGLYADVEDEKEVVKSFINKENNQMGNKQDIYLSNDMLDELLEDKFEKRNFDVQLSTISEVIRENNIKCIDLLKINVEKSELDVLYGIHDNDWSKIKQIAVEVHDINERLIEIINLFKSKGYYVKIEKDWSLEKSAKTNYYVYAVIDDKKSKMRRESCNEFNIEIPEPVLSTPELCDFIKMSLPNYMIPSNFIMIEQIPLTSNGKIDRRALPEPSVGVTFTEYEAPRNEVEEALVKIWSEVLGVEKIGINDNFFDLGGHSLKATMLMSKIHKILNKEVPLKELFKLPTIKDLSKYIESIEENPYSKIEKVEEKEYYETSSAQKRMYMLQQFYKDSIAYNMPAVFELEGKVHKEKLEETFRKLTERHEALRTYFETINGEIVQRIQNSYVFKLEQRNEDKNVEDVVNSFIRPFDLGEAPLFRVELLENHKKTYLLIDMHHIISDGLSMGILIREFAEIYGGKRLELLKLQYKDFAAWQNNILNSKVIKKQEEYWLGRFSDEIPILNIPTDYERPAMQSFEGDSVIFEVNEDITLKLRKLTKETGTTMYMVLISAFIILLSKYSGQEDIIIGMPVAGRLHADLQNIMGMFVNTLALRNKPEGDKKYIEFLKEVKENSIKAYENQSYQFETLIEKLNLRVDASRNPLFGVMFNTIDLFDNNEKLLDGLLIKPYNIKGVSSKVDLELAFKETIKVIELTLTYSTNLYARNTIEIMIEDYIGMLEIIVMNKEMSIDNIIIKCSERNFDDIMELDILEEKFNI